MFAKAVVGFAWYDVRQSHLLSNWTFRSCAPATMAALSGGGGNGVGGSGAFASGSGASGGGGCFGACLTASAVWEFVTHSDQFVPEAMQTTRNIAYEATDPAHLFRFTETSDSLTSTISTAGRLQNWFDADGTATAFDGAKIRGPTIMGSNFAQDWWRLDRSCEALPIFHDNFASNSEEGRMLLCDAATPDAAHAVADRASSVVAAGLFVPSPSRRVASMTLEWDPALTVRAHRYCSASPKVSLVSQVFLCAHCVLWPSLLTQTKDTVGSSSCGNFVSLPCPTLGFVTHWGYGRKANLTDLTHRGLALTANAKVTGVAGYGWYEALSALYMIYITWIS